MKLPLLLIGATLLSACTAGLPEVDPASFACTDDQPLDDDTLACPETHWCLGESCTPRLGCTIKNGSAPGCDPDRKCELFGQDCKRCSLRTNEQVAAVTCEGGVHTETSSVPADLASCDCPDGTTCAVFASGTTGDAYPLYVLPEGGTFPASALGVAGEVMERRTCVRVCGDERDCSAGHTCRPAAVNTRAFSVAPQGSRSTIGVCWPDRLTSTSTLTPITQPDVMSCSSNSDCTGGFEPCRYRIQIIPDHPSAPIGAPWNEHRAMVARCSTEISPSLRNADAGCLDGVECKSGICFSGRCARPCNPLDPEECPANRGCDDVFTTREIGGQSLQVADRVFICGDP